MDNLKKHPAWKEAVEKILARFDEGGYGTIITDDEFDSYLSIKKPEGQFSYEVFKRFETDRLQRYQSLDVLLKDHNICLHRSFECIVCKVCLPR